MPVRSGYYSVLFCIIGLLAAPCRGAEGPSAGLRQRLAELLRPEFEVFAWSPVFFPSVGLVYDNRPEPCSLEIAALQKRIAVAPDDFGARFRLGWLMNQHGTPGSGTAAMADALKACRDKLKEKADDESALIDLTLMMAGTEEAEEAARKAVGLYPKSWRCWDALARHQLRKMEQRLLGNLPTTPQELAAADYSRLQSALKAHAADPELLAAMFALNDEREASAKQAITLAPAEAEAHFDYAEARATAGVIVPSLHRLNNETISEKDADAFDRETLRAVDRAVVLAKDKPEFAAALGFLQIQTRTALAAAAAARLAQPVSEDVTPRPPPPPPKLDERTLPVLNRLKDMAKDGGGARSAAAAEGYAALVTLIPLMGAEPPKEVDLVPLLQPALAQAPERPLLWDLLIGAQLRRAAAGKPEDRKEAQTLASRRMQLLPTARSNAMIAFVSSGEAARNAWADAARMDPTNVEYLLNVAITTLMASQSPESVDVAIALVQRATAVGYSARDTWQKPRLDAFRLRTYAICLIYKGELERAHTLLIDRLRDFPADAASRAIRDALVSE